MFQYQNHCFANYSDALISVCASTPLIASDGAVLSCSPGATNISYERNFNGSVYAATLTPSFPDCSIQSELMTDLYSDLWILPAAAFCALILRRVVK